MSDNILSDFSNILDTYKGRDKVLKTLCYGARLIGGSKKDELSVKLRKFGSQMSAARAVLRLLDDFSTISYVLEYGLGQNEADKFMAVLGLIGNLADLIYCPLDKICWLGATELVNIQNLEYYDNANTISWVVSVYCNLLRSLWTLRALNKKKVLMQQNNNLEYSQVKKKFKNEIFTSIRLTFDLLHSIQCLPPGFLWSSKFEPWQVGMIGTISGLLSLYQMYLKK